MRVIDRYLIIYSVNIESQVHIHVIDVDKEPDDNKEHFNVKYGEKKEHFNMKYGEIFHEIIKVDPTEDVRNLVEISIKGNSLIYRDNDKTGVIILNLNGK